MLPAQLQSMIPFGRGAMTLSAHSGMTFGPLAEEADLLSAEAPEAAFDALLLALVGTTAAPPVDVPPPILPVAGPSEPIHSESVVELEATTSAGVGSADELIAPSLQTRLAFREAGLNLPLPIRAQTLPTRIVTGTAEGAGSDGVFHTPEIAPSRLLEAPIASNGENVAAQAVPFDATTSMPADAGHPLIQSALPVESALPIDAADRISSPSENVPVEGNVEAAPQAVTVNAPTVEPPRPRILVTGKADVELNGEPAEFLTPAVPVEIGPRATVNPEGMETAFSATPSVAMAAAVRKSQPDAGAEPLRNVDGVISWEAELDVDPEGTPLETDPGAPSVVEVDRGVVERVRAAAFPAVPAATQEVSPAVATTFGQSLELSGVETSPNEVTAVPRPLPQPAQWNPAITDVAAAAETLPLSADPAASPSVARQVSDAIVAWRSAAAEQGTARFSAWLSPPELGQVWIEVTRSSRGISARLTAVEDGVQSILESQGPQLRQSLGEAGIRLEDLDVSGGSGRQSHAGDGGGEGSAFYFEREEGVGAPLPAAAGRHQGTINIRA